MKKAEMRIISLNDKLFNEFSVEELEVRLETDPLLFTTLFAGMADNDAGVDVTSCECNMAYCREFDHDGKGGSCTAF